MGGGAPGGQQDHRHRRRQPQTDGVRLRLRGLRDPDQRESQRHHAGQVR